MAVLASDVSGKISAANASAEVLFRVNRRDVLEKSLVDAVGGNIGGAFEELFHAVQKDGRIHEQEFEHLIGGTRLSIGISASPITLKDRADGGTVFVCRVRP